MTFRVVESRTLTGTGEGRPDYTGIDEISRGSFVQSVGQLRENEKLVIWYICLSNTVSAYPWVQSPLVAGATVHLVDVETAMPLPYTIPQGYVLDQLSSFFSFDQKVRTQLFIDKIGSVFQLFSEISMETLGIHYEHEVVGCGTSRFDPLALLPHYFDATGINIDSGSVTGMAYLVWKMTKLHSSEWPKNKIVRCKWCMENNEVPQETTVVTCKSCGKVTVVQHWPWGGFKV